MQVTSDYIFDGVEFKTNPGLILNQEGQILQIFEEGHYDKINFSYYPGLITPGFINAHCHLELSHLKGKFATGTGLISFLNAVVSNREYEMSIITQAITEADEEMYHEGIVAVGDISNKTDSLKTKIASKIRYYNFIECFDFMQDESTDQFIEPYLEIYKSFGALAKSLSPHAPYSVSRKLFSEINNYNSAENIISIHNQEVKDEDDLFIDKTGGIESFFNKFGFTLNHFQPIGLPSIYYTIQNLDPKFQTLFIHNTRTTEDDIKAVMEWNNNIYFVTCPNANLFIENKLPIYNNFIKSNSKICIGTDSLSSNWRLSVLEEIKTILKYQSNVSFLETLQWATKNGAEALKMDKDLGTIEINKTPGINWIQNIEKINNELKLKPNAIVHKLI